MKKVLLIVDDEALVRKALSSQLENVEVEILLANDGQEGLKLALEKHPDLILLDLVMPKMDGMTMLQELRKDEWGKNAKVIILTNLSDAEKLTETADEGNHEYLVKVDWSVTDVIKKITDELGCS